jgi:hypothetical protein
VGEAFAGPEASDVSFPLLSSVALGNAEIVFFFFF